MMWEAAAWSAVGVWAIPVARRLEPRIAPVLGDRAEALQGAGTWLHGLVPPFAALFSGAVPARHLGLFGQGGWLHWLLGGVPVIALTLGVRAALSRWPVAVPGIDSQRVVLDEPRWALYRATGWLWLGDPWLGTLIGLTIAASEWALARRIWVEVNRREPVICLDLARLGWSSLIFALTFNFYWVLAFQLAWLMVLKDQAEGAQA